MTKFIVKPDSR